MSLRYLTGYVCAAVAALILSHNAATAMVRPDAGLARIAHAAAAIDAGAGAIVKVARRGRMSGGHVKGGFHARSFSRSPGVMHAPRFRSFGGTHRSFRVYRGGAVHPHVYRGVPYGRHYSRRYRGRRIYTPIVPYFYGYLPYTYYYFEYPSGQCAYWHRRCVRRWGYRTNNYYGCMRYYGCL